MKFLLRVSLIFYALVAACGTQPEATATPRVNPVAPTSNAAATETAVTKRVLATLTANASPQDTAVPTAAETEVATVTPPQPVSTTAPTNPPPTLSSALSPSVTPVPVRATPIPAGVPTLAPTQAPLTVSREALLGKILFKSSRDNGKYPNRFEYYVMNGDGSDVQPVNKAAATELYQMLKPLEGYSPDKSLLVLGEETCGGTGRCDLYLGPPESIMNRSQGQWTQSNRRDRFYDPVWSPDAGWIAFVWNNSEDKTKNVFKGPPQSNPQFVRLTNFFAGKDTKNPTYSPDGSQLAFTTQDGDRWQIWVLNANADNFTDANAHNLGNSTFDDWDPLWVK